MILNSHGGNDFRQMIRELQATCGVFIASINWWNCIDPKPFYHEPGDHAGELETECNDGDRAGSDSSSIRRRRRTRAKIQNRRTHAAVSRGRHAAGLRSPTTQVQAIHQKRREKKG